MTIADIEHPLGFGSTEFHVIRVDQDALDTRYLYHYLRRPALRAKGQVKMKGSAGQKRLPTFFLERLKIPLPPLDEQRHIAAVLDRADALRIKRRRAQAMLNDLLRSAFVEMFGESRATRVHFADVITNLRNGLSPASAGTFSGRVLTLDAVTGAGYNREAMKKAVFDREMPPDKLVDPRDFLICRGNGNIELVGRGAFPDREETDVLFPDTMIGARIDEGQILPEYLEMAWRTQDLRDQIERGARTTNGTHKINQKVLNAIELPLPTMEKQAKFAKIGSVRISVYGSGRG
jgi:type I restriction enzyme S subunit